MADAGLFELLQV